METVNFIKTEEIQDKIEDLFIAQKLKLSRALPNAIIEHIGGAVDQ
jgi:hypothetical protein